MSTVMIIKELSCVDSIVPVLNDDKFDVAGGAIFHLLSTTGNDTKIIVANGGDRGQGNVPEQKTFDNNRRVEFVYGVGGDSKTNSSSWILDEWKTQKTEREWGHWSTNQIKDTKLRNWLYILEKV